MQRSTLIYTHVCYQQVNNASITSEPVTDESFVDVSKMPQLGKRRALEVPGRIIEHVNYQGSQLKRVIF
jgi:hypothetical protein